jgi:epoxyqueuosine reductase
VKNELKEVCSQLGIEFVGIAPIGPYIELKEIIERNISRGHVTSFEESEINKRVDPSLTMINVKSIIVCLFPYAVDYDENSNISNYTYSIDYHIVARKKLEQISEYLCKKIDNFEYKAFVDTGALPDRYLAHLAGLGYYGINSHIITDRFGSYVFIGYILTNYPFETDNPIDKTCIRCGTCVKKCPGNAILGDFTINPHRCISYLTQKKGDLTEEEISIIRKGNLVFGCDICQKVCPHNRRIQQTNIEEFKQNLIYKIDYCELLNISNKEFKKRYGDRAFSWRGKSILLRNFEYVYNNHVK